MYSKRNKSIFQKTLDDMAPITSENKVWSISKISQEFADKASINYIDAKIEDLNNSKFDKVMLNSNVLEFFANDIKRGSVTLTSDNLDLSSLMTVINTKYDGVEVINDSLLFKIGNTVATTIELPSAGPPIVNDLTTGGADKILSAEMGKTLNDRIISDTQEIVESRIDYSGQEHPNLEARLNKEFEKIYSGITPTKMANAITSLKKENEKLKLALSKTKKYSDNLKSKIIELEDKINYVQVDLLNKK